MSFRSRTTFRQIASDPRYKRDAVSAVDSLCADEKMAALMPTVLRIAAIQKACQTILPDMFGSCSVIRIDAEQLVLSATNASMAARLKQQLPKLQDALKAAAWQVSAIQIKVQPKKNPVESKRSEKPALPAQAIAAFTTLGNSLENSLRNKGLREAINTLIQRHR